MTEIEVSIIVTPHCDRLSIRRAPGSDALAGGGGDNQL